MLENKNLEMETCEKNQGIKCSQTPKQPVVRAKSLESNYREKRNHNGHRSET